MRIVAVSKPPASTRAAAAAATAAAAIFPQPPLAGFSPLVAVTTSDSHAFGEFDWVHRLQYSYTGSPLNPPARQNYVVGVFDSGATADVIGSCDAGILGISSAWISPIGEAGLACLSNQCGTPGSIPTEITQPLGVFAAGLGAIQVDGSLDLTQVIGHTNVSVLVSPDEPCADGLNTPSLIGTPLLAFFETVIRNDLPRTVNVGGPEYTSPDVQILPPGDPRVPVYPRRISLTFGGASPVTTASYYPDLEDFVTPWLPTQLSLSPESFPLGGAFFATVGVLEGEPGPTNPLQNVTSLVDTGAQSSIMSCGVAANLSLPLTPDFTVDVFGVCGLLTDVPGYYVDYVKINAAGGALEFSQVPFVVMDLPSVDGGTLPGVLGMNFFWDRNIVFQPSISGSGFVHVSDPVAAVSQMDFDGDSDVDLIDFNHFQACFNGANRPAAFAGCGGADADSDADVDLVDFSEFQRCFNGPNRPPRCI